MMLAVNDLDVSYGNIAALHGLSISLEQGSLTTLIGIEQCGGPGIGRLRFRLCQIGARTGSRDRTP